MECLKIGLLNIRAIGEIMSVMQNKKEGMFVSRKPQYLCTVLFM